MLSLAPDQWYGPGKLLGLPVVYSPPLVYSYRDVCLLAEPPCVCLSSTASHRTQAVRRRSLPELPVTHDVMLCASQVCWPCWRLLHACRCSVRMRRRCSRCTSRPAPWWPTAACCCRAQGSAAGLCWGPGLLCPKAFPSQTDLCGWGRWTADLRSGRHAF